MSDDARACQNCDAPLRGPFCHQCGQRDQDVRVAIWELLKEAGSETFELDGRVPRTLVALFAKPGLLVQEYVAGRRRRYSGPVRLFLLSLAASFLAFQLAGSRALDGVAARFAEQPLEIVDHELAFELRDEAEDGVSFAIGLDERSEVWFAEGIAKLEGRTQAQAAAMLLDGFLDATPLVVVVLVPLLALLLEVLYPRFLVIEHLLLSTYLHAVGLLSLGVSALVGHWTVELAVIGLLGWHVVASQKRIYGQRWWVLALKTCAVVFGYGVMLTFAFVGSLLATLWLL